MNESRAWLVQAGSDFKIGNRLLDKSDGRTFCHTIAKFQQAVEKSIKGLASALTAARIVFLPVGRDHRVERFLAAFLRLPRDPSNRSLQRTISGLFNEVTRGQIRAIDTLVPRWPAPGARPARNTEYPFLLNDNEWHPPAEAGIFDGLEVDRYRQLAWRIVDGYARIVAAVERRPG